MTLLFVIYCTTVPAAWQIQQPGGNQVHTLPTSGPVIAQLPVQAPSQVAVPLPAQIPLLPVQQPQPSPQPVQAAVPSTMAPAAPEPKPGNIISSLWCVNFHI